MDKSIILFIDSSKQDTVSVALTIGDKRFKKTSNSKVYKAQMVLPLIEELLSEQSLSIHDISEIAVHTGPGSYTGLRVGAAIANTLGFVLHIPVNGEKSGISVPSY